MLLTEDHMGLKVSKCHCFYKVHVVLDEYKDIGCHVGIQDLAFLGSLPSCKRMWHLKF